MNFVTISSGQFRLDGSRFRFIGVNTYDLFKGEYTEPQLSSYFRYVKDNGIKVIRTWAFGGQGNSAGNLRYISGNSLLWREDGFIALDRVIKVASDYGIRLILSLTNEFSYGSDKEMYCSWNNTINGTAYTHDGNNRCWEFMTDSNIKATFKEFLSKIINRTNTITGIDYKNDP